LPGGPCDFDITVTDQLIKHKKYDHWNDSQSAMEKRQSLV
jgi:hypothetical protein